MKRIISILAIIFCSAQMFASELIIRGEIDVPFSVFVNGEKYYSYYSKVTISNLPRGIYDVEIYTESSSNDLLYDCRIEVPKNSRVTATFTGDNQITISSDKYTKPVIIQTTVYPHSAEPGKPMIRKSEPRNPEPAKVEPKKSEPKKVEPAKTEKKDTEPTKRTVVNDGKEKPAQSTPKASSSTNSSSNNTKATSSSSSSRRTTSSSSTTSSSTTKSSQTSHSSSHTSSGRSTTTTRK